MIAKYILLLICIATVRSANANHNSLTNCLNKVKVNNSNEYKVEINNSSVKRLSPQFFGFNVNWFGFQLSYWDDKKRKIDDRIIRSLKHDFKGAIYRYPGGTVSNRFDWQSSIGPYESRPYQKPVAWHKPIVTKFGYQEFIDFVKSVDGEPWIVNNLYGNFNNEENLDILSDKANKWAKYSLSQQHNVVGWELGNELDRGKYSWSAEKYSKRAIKVGEAIKNVYPNARLVIMLRDYNVNGHGSANRYNRELARKTSNLAQEFALHQYYDGPPGGPSIPNRLVHICSSIDDLKKETESDLSIWITEHARWPVAKKPINWKIEKQQTYNLQSAISVADYVIAVSLLPDVKGAFIHALANEKGPWALFHRTNNSIKPTIVYNALQLLRKNMLSEVLDINIESRNESNYFGHYDIRASVQTNIEHTKYAIWLVNRAKMETPLTFTIPQLASQKMNADMLSLFDNDLSRNNINSTLLPVSTKLRMNFNENGDATLKIPGQSISSIFIQ